jgi:hypothetical protein
MCSLDIYDQGLMLQSIEEGVLTILGHIYLKNTWLDTLFYRL